MVFMDIDTKKKQKLKKKVKPVKNYLIFDSVIKIAPKILRIHISLLVNTY